MNDSGEQAATAAAEDGGGDTREGIVYALCAYLLWGFVPFYMKAVAHLPTAEVVAHRIVWSVPLAGILLIVMGRTSDIRRALRSPRTVAQGSLTAVLIAINWSIYVWAISADRTVETALGYYINPLFSVFLAAVLLGEKLTRLQMIAILFATAGVSLMTWHVGGLPWVSIGLALSWGFYALLKKTLPIGPAQGFFMEVLLLSAAAISYVAYVEVVGDGHFFDGMGDASLLMFAGVATAVPLIFYANGTKKLRLSTIGIMQYIAPTIIFVIAVFVFREPFDSVRLAGFGLIWTALFLYTWSLMRLNRRAKAAVVS